MKARKQANKLKQERGVQAQAQDQKEGPIDHFVVLPTPPSLEDIDKSDQKTLARQGGFDAKRLNSKNKIIICLNAQLDKNCFSNDISALYRINYSFQNAKMMDQYEFLISGHGSMIGVGVDEPRLRQTPEQLSASFAKSFPKDFRKSKMHFTFHSCNSAYFITTADEKSYKTVSRAGNKLFDIDQATMQKLVQKQSLIGRFFNGMSKNGFTKVSVTGVYGFFQGEKVTSEYPNGKKTFDTSQQKITIGEDGSVSMEKGFIPFVKKQKVNEDVESASIEENVSPSFVKKKLGK